MIYSSIVVLLSPKRLYRAVKRSHVKITMLHPRHGRPQRGGHGSHSRNSGSEIIEEGCCLSIQGIEECVSYPSRIFEPQFFPM